MNENTSKKREWVKNAAIIFLTVMLILTFFSNTFMNYSLPEVATQYVTAGSITAKIRGTGTIAASDPYNVVIKESRIISSVATTVGAVVEKGDVLFKLEDADSTELQEAQKALDALVLAYETKLLDGTIDSSVIDNVEGGDTSTTEEYKDKIQAAISAEEKAQKNVDAKQATVTVLARAISLLTSNVVENTTDTAALYTANTNLLAAKATLTTNQNNLTYYKGVLDSYPTASEAATTLTTKETELTTATTNKDNAKALSDASPADAALLAAYNTALATYNTALTARDNAKAVVTAINNYTQYVAAEEVKVASATLTVANYQAIYDKEVSALNAKKTDADAQLVAAQTALTTATANKTKLIANIQAEINLGSQTTAIATQQALVDKLKSESVGATITAPVAGTITAVNFVAGQTAAADAVMAVIQIADKGFTLEFAVTSEQAKNLQIGDAAEVVNSWYYNELKATLASIKADPANPGKSKILHFDITGDVQTGQSVSLSVGQKTADYDLIVPNSAIREDKNGKFILTVEEKNSPLGNRYIATRVDVEVLASDDTQTAISAALYGYEYVITTSSKPVEAGKQVRLAE